MTRLLSRTVPVLALSLALAACGGNKKAALDDLDARLGNSTDDPALTVALEDQIMVDPNLAKQANDDSIRPAEKPVQTPIPPGEGASASSDPGQTLGALAARQAQVAKERFTGCSLDVDYSAGWAARLPAEFPVYPKSRIVEAAGSDNGGCGLRVVSYIAPGGPDAVAKYYAALANKAGFRAGTTNQDGGMMVSGWRPSDGAAFYAVIKMDAGGSATDFVSNRGG